MLGLDGGVGGAVVAAHPRLEDVRAADEIGDERAGRPLVDLARGADLFDPALREDGDAVGEGERLGLVVGDVDRRLAEPPLQKTQLVAHLDAQLEVQVGQRLVEQKEARLQHERAGDGHALLLAAGELGGVARPEARQVDEVQHLADPALDRRLVDLAQPQAEGDVVEHREVGEQRVVLEDESDVAAMRRPVVQSPAAQRDGALGQRLESRDAAKRRRLAAAAGAEEREELALHHLEGQGADGDLGRVPLGQPPDLELDLGPGHRLSPAPPCSSGRGRRRGAGLSCDSRGASCS